MLDHDRHPYGFMSPSQAVALCGASYEKQLEINDWTHNNGVHFISAETRGLFG